MRLEEATKPEAQTMTARRSDQFGIIMRSDVGPAEVTDGKISTMGDVKTIGRWTINPRGKRWCNNLDSCIAFSLLYTAIVTPFEIAFLEPGIDALFVMGNIVNLVFIVDMLLQFFLHYELHTEYGQMMEVSRWEGRWVQLEKVFFGV